MSTHVSTILFTIVIQLPKVMESNIRNLHLRCDSIKLILRFG